MQCVCKIFLNIGIIIVISRIVLFKCGQKSFNKIVRLINDIEAGKMKIEWGSQIRNYVLHPYKLIKDVRTQQETAAVDDVLNGDIDRFLKAFLMTQQQNTNESPWEK